MQGEASQFRPNFHVIRDMYKTSQDKATLKTLWAADFQQIY